MFSLSLGSFPPPNLYLTLVIARALLSVFWNKARIKLFTSVLVNSNARGPLLSAHLRREIIRIVVIHKVETIEERQGVLMFLGSM